MASYDIFSCEVCAGTSDLSRVIAGPITQVPTNIPTAIAAIAARTGSDRNVDACSRWLGIRMRVSEYGNVRPGGAFLRARKLADLALLVLAKPHQERHRRPDQLLHLRAVDIDVQLAAGHMLRAAKV